MRPGMLECVCVESYTHTHVCVCVFVFFLAVLCVRAFALVCMHTADACPRLHHRMWTLVDGEGTALTQKVEPHLARIQTSLLLGASHLQNVLLMCS